MKSYTELEGEQGCRVPLSIGTPVEAGDALFSGSDFRDQFCLEDFDKKGEPCISYDVVANPEAAVWQRVLSPGRGPNAFGFLRFARWLSNAPVNPHAESRQWYQCPWVAYVGCIWLLSRLFVVLSSSKF